MEKSLPQGPLDPSRVRRKRVRYPEHITGDQKSAGRDPDIGV